MPFESTARWLQSNPVALGHTERILPSVEGVQGDTSVKVRTVLQAVFADPEIQSAGKGAVIRYTSMCGEVVRRILYKLGLEPDLVNILAIGDVTLPPEAKRRWMKLWKSLTNTNAN